MPQEQTCHRLTLIRPAPTGVLQEEQSAGLDMEAGPLEEPREPGDVAQEQSGRRRRCGCGPDPSLPTEPWRLGEEDSALAGLGGRAVGHLDNVVGSVRSGIQLLFGTALLVVLVGCVNLGNLFLARTADRRRELAIRSSLGAGPEIAASVATVSVGRDYFTSTGIPLLAGREISAGDGLASPRKVVVSESFARASFGRRDIVGRRLLMGSDDAPSLLEIVGVAGESRQLSVLQPPAPTVFLPIAHATARRFFLLLSTRGDPAAIVEAARGGALEVDPTLKVAGASALGPAWRQDLSLVRLRMVLMAALAGLAGVLALIGIAGVVAHFLSEQTRDVGIRMALGAGTKREVARVVQHALRPTALGLSAGVLVAIASSSVMESFLYGIEPTDPLTYVTATLALLVTATLAAWIPARRTAAVDPARVLNREG